jgi:FAD/FMN-containing dehydrogenase
MSETTRAHEALARLEQAIDGTVVLPGTRQYDEARRRSAWAQFDDIRPAAIIRCATADDVGQAVVVARQLELQVAARSGAHCFAGRSSTDGVVVDLDPMGSVGVADGIATVGGGALLGAVYERLDAEGLTVAGGACPTVGVGGLTLGGGLGVLGRTHGLTSDQLVEAEVVLADGRVVVCDGLREPDLFWALRGAGGGQFGIATRFAFRTVPAPELTCFTLAWPWLHAVEAIEGWQAWAPDAADAVAASLLANVFAEPREPVVSVFGAMLADEAETAATLDELVGRIGVGPTETTLARLPHLAAKRHLAEHAPGVEGEASSPPLMHAKSEFFRRPLPRDVIEALVEHLVRDRMPGQARELDFTPWGGAYSRTPAAATAFAHRSERFLLKHAVVLDAASSSQERGAAGDWLTRSWSLVHPYGAGGVFPNFPDPDLPDPLPAYHGENLGRLMQVKRRYDPDDVFRFPQSIPPARAS